MCDVIQVNFRRPRLVVITEEDETKFLRNRVRADLRYALRLFLEVEGKEEGVTWLCLQLAELKRAE